MFSKAKYEYLVLAVGLYSSAVLAGTVGPAGPSRSYLPQLSLQLGGFWASQGTRQAIAIDGLIGDYFTVSRGTDSNGLVGVGLYWEAMQTQYANFSYGVNAFYLPNTSVRGEVVQEYLYNNLSYSYSVTNWPIYFGAKADIQNSFMDRVSVTLDAGIGPNIINANNFKERSLDGGITIPDNIFTNHTSTAFTAMVGAGLKFHDLFGKAALECGYRYFSLGQGQFGHATDQVPHALKTGYSYANAILCAVVV